MQMFACTDARPSGPPETEASDDDRRLGLLRDLPLCRYSWCLLPGHQIAMSGVAATVHLMFGKLLATPPRTSTCTC